MDRHMRKCFDCGSVAEHEDSIVPHVLCKKCKSRDTRRVKVANDGNRFRLIDDRPHLLIGHLWVPLVDAIATLDALIDSGVHDYNETALHALRRVNEEWSKTGRLPKENGE